MPSMQEIRQRIREGKNVRAKPMADAVGMSLSAFYAACERGDVKTISVGRTRLIPAHEAARLLAMTDSAVAA